MPIGMKALLAILLAARDMQGPVFKIVGKRGMARPPAGELAKVREGVSIKPMLENMVNRPSAMESARPSYKGGVTPPLETAEGFYLEPGLIPFDKQMPVGTHSNRRELSSVLHPYDFKKMGMVAPSDDRLYELLRHLNQLY